MSAFPSGSAVAARLAPAKPTARGFLHIVRHGGGPNALYIVTYRRVEVETSRDAARPRPVDFHLREVRGALEDILRLGSANIPDLWLSDEEMIEKGLVEG